MEFRHLTKKTHTEDESDHPLRVSDVREQRNPARPLYQNTPTLDETRISNEDSEEDDYHTQFTPSFCCCYSVSSLSIR